MSKLYDLAQLGQSVWYDNICQALLESGDLQDLIDAGVTGVTSNPSIFEKAIAGSHDYDAAIQAQAGKTAAQVYEALALDNIAQAADLLRPVYDKTDGADGFVSLEVSPTLAHDAAGTVAEARRLFAALGRPNVMIKVPATEAGIVALRQLISAGINVNATLIFSLAHHEAVMEAYLQGLEAREGDWSGTASVASFFVSRVDTAVDLALAEIGNETLRGKIAIANAKVAYGRFQQTFSGSRWQKLAARGAQAQRLVWASTSAKNPAYPDTLYIDTLIGSQTVNTIPPAAFNAFLDHGVVAPTLAAGLDEAQAQLAQLAALGIDLDAVTQKLQEDGVAAFAQAFDSLLNSISASQHFS